MGEQSPDQPKQWSGILRFFSNHPLLGLLGALGSIASIIALPFTLFPPDRKLAYSISPTRGVLVQSAGSGDLTAAYKGIAITGNVVVAQVAIWNAGRQAIKSEDRLSGVALNLATNCHLLGADIVKQTRLVVGFSSTFQPLGRSVTVDWKILEHNDGGLVQLIYSGSPDAPIDMEGTIIGQSGPRLYRSAEKIRLVAIILGALFSGIFSTWLVTKSQQVFITWFPKLKMYTIVTSGLILLLVCSILGAVVSMAINGTLGKHGASPFGF
jgi:hypothetical protein